jgi:formylglycine-generating enzyme required for sulfatase activity
MRAQVRPYVLTAEQERAVVAGASFRECAKECPEMIVIPAGDFMMGSPASEKARYDDEGPQHKVTIAKPFAVSKFDVTFADWDIWWRLAGAPSERRWYGAGRSRSSISAGTTPSYMAWVSQMTGKPIACSRSRMGIRRSRWDHHGLCLGR